YGSVVKKCQWYDIIATFNRAIIRKATIAELNFFCNASSDTQISTLSLHDALPISLRARRRVSRVTIESEAWRDRGATASRRAKRSEEHTSELQSQSKFVCRLLLEKKTSSSGRSRQGAPVRRIQRMPSTISRRSRLG